jgi:RTX calcium-binding nonapeptide repeat (4 copies)
LIKIQNILTLAVIISLILPLQYNTLKFANGQLQKDSTLVMYNDNSSKLPVLADSKNTILKPQVDVSIEGTPNDDQLKGGDGDDKISGEDGHDKISGGEGNDKINGGKENDTLNGELGNDTLKGGNGNDKLSGESGNDLMEGGKGDDTLIAGEGDEGMLGNEGNDVLNGGEGVDIMAGGLGNDTFICDLFDTILDFNLIEGDKIVGQCSSLDQTERIESQFGNIFREDFGSGSPALQPQFPKFTQENIPLEFPHEAISLENFEAEKPSQSPAPFHPNNIPPQELKIPQQPQQSEPKPQPPTQPPYSNDDIPPEDLESFPLIPVPPSKEVYL